MESLDDYDGILWKLFPLENMSRTFNRKSIEHLNRKHVTSTLILGPKHSYKTTLLFQAAVTHCEKSQSGVLFIMQKPLSDLPSPVHGMPRPTRTNMTHLQFAYINGHSEFMKFLTSFHELHKASYFNPTLICVDGLDRYIEQPEGDLTNQEAGHLAKILALLQDIAYFSALKGKRSCPLLVSCAKIELITTSSNTLKHFFDRVWNLLETSKPDNESKREDQRSNIREKRFILNKIIGHSTIVDSVTFEQKSEEIYLRFLKNNNKIRV